MKSMHSERFTWYFLFYIQNDFIESNKPNEFGIFIAPASIASKTGSISLELLFKLSMKYPNESPDISISKRNLISDIHCKELLDILKLKAKELLGNECIYELIETSKVILVGNN